MNGSSCSIKRPEQEAIMERTKELAALERAIEAFGADAARWPAASRDSLMKLVSEDPAASARLTEARALDRLLDLAPRPAQGLALADRIVAAALTSPARRQADTDAGRVIPFPRWGGT